MAENQNTEQVLWEAARKVFLTKGLAGARMKDIAGEAGMNKALLHYYYRSKENLFGRIFQSELDNFFRIIDGILDSDAPFHEKIRRLVDGQFGAFIKCPELPVFLLSELRSRTDCLGKNCGNPVSRVRRLLAAALEAECPRPGNRPVDPEQFFIHLVSLTLFPFIAKPMIQSMFGMDETGFSEFLQRRKEEICQVLFRMLEGSGTDRSPSMIPDP